LDIRHVKSEINTLKIASSWLLTRNV